jgi:hypothetical protein
MRCAASFCVLRGSALADVAMRASQLEFITEFDHGFATVRRLL